MPVVLQSLPRTVVPLRPAALVGLPALRRIDEPFGLVAQVTSPLPDLPGLDGLVDAMSARPRGLVLTMGKGGVGKTTVAAAVAVELARSRSHSSRPPAPRWDLTAWQWSAPSSNHYVRTRPAFSRRSPAR